MKISATQINKYRRCQRLYAFEYVEGHKPPPSKKQEFGSAVHKQLEEWLRLGRAPDDSPEGRVAKQGIKNGWLPTPRSGLLVEHEFSFSWFPGVEMIGFIDCVEPDDEEPLVIDHKTTSDLRWAMGVDDLRKDPQALLYAVWAAKHYRAPVVRARWLYYAASNPKTGPRKPAGARPVEVKFDCRQKAFIDEVKALNDDIAAIARIRKRKTPALDLPASPGACEMYGGCFHRDERCRLTGPEKLAAYLR